MRRLWLMTGWMCECGEKINDDMVCSVCEKDYHWLGEFAGVRHVVSCSSGTDALIMAMMVYGIGPGDAVFTTPFTFIATAEAVRMSGAVPVFVDIDPGIFNMSVEKLETAVKEFKKGPLQGW